MTATISMDPRIRARRDEVAAENDRRRSVKFVVFVMVLLVLVAAALSTRSPLLDVNELTVEGASRTRADDVRAVSGIEPGDALTDLDLGAARIAIAALPWVDEVKSTRRWDGTVVFDITERRAVAQTVSADGSAVALVDPEGRVLEVAGTPRPELVSINGAQGSFSPGGWLASNALDAVAVAAAIPSGLAPVIDQLDVGDDGSITLQVEEFGAVVLGGSVDLDLKFTALATMLDQVDLSCVDVLDLQVPSVPVLTRNGSC